MQNIIKANVKLILSEQKHKLCIFVSKSYGRLIHCSAATTVG